MILFPVFCCSSGSAGSTGMQCPMPWCGRAVLKYFTYSLMTQMQLSFIENPQVIETLAADTPQKTFTNRVCLEGSHRRSENLDAAGCPRERSPIFAIVVTDQKARLGVQWGCFT